MIDFLISFQGIIFTLCGIVALCFCYMFIRMMVKYTYGTVNEEKSDVAPEPVYENYYRITKNFDGTFTVRIDVFRDGLPMGYINCFNENFPTREEAEKRILEMEYVPDVEMVKVEDGKIVPVEVKS